MKATWWIMSLYPSAHYDSEKGDREVAGSLAKLFLDNIAA
jgi:hypothetical protein